MLDSDPRRLLSAWCSAVKPTPAQRTFLSRPDQLLQWGGSIASGGSTAVMYGAGLAGSSGRALLVCDEDRFARTLEAWPASHEAAPVDVVRLDAAALTRLHRDLSSPWMRFSYIGVLGSVPWEVSQILLALLAPGGKIRSRPDLACPHLGELWFPAESSTGLYLLELIAKGPRP